MREEKLIPDNIKPFLNEIAERLWSEPSHAAIMVGAGFSKNANSCFPDWNQLGDLFFEKIHGRKPTEGEDRYLNVLKLANEVETAFGRPVLNKLLKDAIPEESSSPSELHRKLLELPWTDVFTTNYDTLLEKASNSIISRRYDLVMNKEDLVYSEQPRIIKLHGSFPSETPFIITEEDYRTYPIQFAPLVNTVQQSLLENTLCLIGFSGDDPNFLQWIGWIRDNLGRHHSSKIYLVGLFNISESQKYLLEERNIVLVDLKECKGVYKNDHRTALNIFFEYLNNYRKTRRQGNWPQEDFFHLSSQKDEINERMKEQTEIWIKTRNLYPGWEIAPVESRSRLWHNTQDWLNSSFFDNIDKEQLLCFLFELNWRLEKSLYPIPNHFIPLYDDCINLFINSRNESLQKKAINLKLSKLRWLREEGHQKEWEILFTELRSSFGNILSKEQFGYLDYQNCLNKLFILNIGELKSALTNWNIDGISPVWAIRKSSLMLEIGLVDNARSVIDLTLVKIREKLNLNPIEDDYYMVSLEAIAMVISDYVNSVGNWGMGANENKISDEEYSEIVNSYKDRWNVLKSYGCDPIGDSKVFDYKLQKEPLILKSKSKKYLFDIGRSSTSYKSFGWDKEALEAYRYLRFIEESGLIIRTSNINYNIETASGAVKRIAKNSSWWALITSIRLGDSQYQDNIFNRASLQYYSTDEVDSIAKILISAIKNAEKELKNHSRPFRRDSFEQVMVKVIPEILSRICTKASFEIRSQIIDLIKFIYTSEQKCNFEGVNRLSDRLISTLNFKEVIESFKLFLHFSYPKELTTALEDEFPHPLSFIDENKIRNCHLERDDESVIADCLIKANSTIKNERNWGITVLIKLFYAELLPQKYYNRLGKALWGQVHKTTLFPANTRFDEATFIRTPHPANINPIDLLKELVAKTKFPIINGTKQFSFSNGHISSCERILRSRHFVEWKYEEISVLLQDLFDWWSKDKDSFKSSKTETKSVFPTKHEELQKRFNVLKDLLIYFFAPVLAKESILPAIKEQLSKLITELDEYDVNNLDVKSSFYKIIDINIDGLLLDIKSAIKSNNADKHKNALNAAFLLVERYYNDIDRQEVLSIIGDVIEWQHPKGLAKALKIAASILKEDIVDMNNQFIEKCLNGLEILLDSTKIDIDSSNNEVGFKLEVKKAAVSLASVIYKSHLAVGKTIPEIILKWKEIAESPDSFSEFRVIWFNCTFNLQNN